MPRSPTENLPRMQNQPRLRVPPVAHSPDLVPLEREAPPPKPQRRRLMRQYELIERVKQYNPNANEKLLDRA